MEQYLTVKELSERLKLARQTIYNMIHKRDFILNHHYFKPTPRKILFKWSAMKNWLEGDGFDEKRYHLILSFYLKINKSRLLIIAPQVA